MEFPENVSTVLRSLSFLLFKTIRNGTEARKGKHNNRYFQPKI